MRLQIVGGQGFASETSKVARFVGVAGDDRAAVRLLRRLAQGRIGPKVSRLDEEEGLRIELTGQVSGERIRHGRRFLAFRGEPEAYEAAAAHHREGGQFPLEAAAVVGEIAVAE